MPIHRVRLLFWLWCAGWPVGFASRGNSIPVDISALFNNKAFGTYPGEAAFDTLGQSYPRPRAEDTPRYTSGATGVSYVFPGYTGPGKWDNVVCAGQRIGIPRRMSGLGEQGGEGGRGGGEGEGGNAFFFSASFLLSGDVEDATVAGNVTFEYGDGSSSDYELRTLDWFSFLTINRGEIIFPYRFTGEGEGEGVNWNASHIFERTAALEVGKELRAIRLPEVEDGDGDGDGESGRMHVFAVSLWAGREDEGGVQVQAVRATQKWMGVGEQIVEVTVNNVGRECLAGEGILFSLEGKGLETSTKGHVQRLCPGDQKIVKVGVRGDSDGPSDIEVVVDDGKKRVGFEHVEIGLTDWTTDLDNLARHEAPDWFDAAKFGIFVHWGPYAVTGWGNSTPHESYAEWFWWYSTHHPQADPSDVYDYRLRTFGRDWAYDDTFPNFTASNFDPKAWVDLFADAGAQYFVITSKHHDGFALFDTGHTTNRSSLHYGPQRDLLRDIFDAAARYQPSLKRGTYFSLPEWFNPDFGPYGYDQQNSTLVPGTNSWPGVPARNPYTGLVEPYTGRIPVDDFLTDVMLPQMEILAYDYETDIMWCDVGAANVTAEFAAAWWNTTRAENRQVTMNSRCGLAQAADFDTPEYATFSSAQARKWESNMGMDPFSYGYNSATAPGAYMNASTLVKTLVDVVAKNGNLLLDVGPRADGTIVEAEVRNLKEAGRWIHGHGEAIFNTTVWFVRTEVVGDGVDVRFTQTETAFYVLFLERPGVEGGFIRVPAPVPILEGDVVSMVGVGVEGGEHLAWHVSGKGEESVLNVQVDDALLDKDDYCWVFRIQYA